MMKPREIFIGASCLALNLALAKVAATLSLPVYLDSVGTILSAVLLGTLPTLVVAIASSLLGGLVVNPYFAAYVGTQISIALVASLAARLGFFEKWWKALIAGLIIAAVSVIASSPVTVVLFGGVTLSGTTAVNAILLASGRSLWQSVVGGSVIIESVDKPTAAVVCWLVLRRLPSRFRNRARADTAPAA